MRSAKMIPGHLIERWRDLLGTAAEMTGASLGRIMVVSGAEVEVALAVGPSASAYPVGARFAIDTPLYCVSVVREQRAVTVVDGSADPGWRESADLARGMRSYLGLPIALPDATLFGVIDLLGQASVPHPEAHRKLLGHFRDTVQDHLAQLAADEVRARADVELRTERERLLLAAEVNRLGVWEYNLDENVLQCDARWYRIFGRDPSEPVTTFEDVARFIHPDDLLALEAARTENQSGRVVQGTDQSHQFRIVLPNGDIRWISSASRSVEAGPLSPNRLVGIAVDVTEAHLAEEKLRRSYETLKQTEKLARIGGWRWDIGNDVITWSEAADELFGWDPTLPQPNFAEAAALFTPESWAQIGVYVTRCLETGEPYSVEAEAVRTDGEHFFVHARGEAAKDADGNTTSLFGTILDITQRKEAERAVEERERWLLDMVENLPAGAILLKGDQFLANRAVEEITGYDRHELISREIWFEKLLGDADGTAMQRYRENRAGGFHRVVTTPFVKKDGTHRLAEMAAAQVGGDEIWLMQDVTEKHRLSEALANERERLLLATEAGAIGIWGVDYREPRVSWDDQMHLLHGLAPGAFGGKIEDWHALMHHDDRERVLARWGTEPSATSVYGDEFRIVRPDGDIRHMRVTARVFRGGDGRPERLVGVNLDVTAAHRTAEMLSAARDAAEAAERAKSNFLATMSHEIRTPMNTVIGMTQLALRGDVDAKQRSYLEKIDISGKTLLAIINDILDFSKIEAGRLELEDTEFTLESVLESVSTVTAVRAEEKSIEIAFGVSADVPRVLQGDPLRLSQVLINLVSNAVKFTDEGEVVVAVDAVHGVGGKAMLRFTVRDTGVGLDTDQLASLFDRFTQADNETARRYGGTGLGLAISRQLVEMMGGRISVESRLGAGSTFSFTIEARRPARHAASAAMREQHSLDGLRVLIVDDNASARAILTDMVDGFGMAAVAVTSGREALVTLRAASTAGEPFALVLMDWRMPDMDGLETARQIRADESLARTPAILMVTAYGREEVLKRADQLELQGLLIKPITESMMFNAIINLFSAPLVADPLDRLKSTASVNGEKADDVLAVLAGRRVLVVDDNAFNREVASEFLLSAGMQVDAVESGAEALERLRRFGYDAVLMDVQMPVMDGPTTTREIRRNPAWASLPIIALTAQARVEDREASLRAGMSAHLTKPVDETLLFRTLANVLSGAASPVAMSSDGAPAAKVDLGAALKLLGDDQDRLARLLRGFLRDFAETPGHIGKLLAADDFAELGALAHMTRGPAGYLGARALVQAAEALERTTRYGNGDLAREQAVLFRDALTDVLAEIGDSAAVQLESARRPTSAAQSKLPALIGQIEPLVARGDFAANALLSRLAKLLNGHRHAVIVETARSHFEDLELESALAALANLRVSLAADDDGAAV